MSLFLGNLSAHIQKEDIEHVFQRFGRCNMRMKDGYGFVIFEEPFNAEKALRALRGKLICGEQINLSWSNKQPRNFHKFARNNRFYEPSHRRNFRDGDLNNPDYDRRDFAWQRPNNRRALRLTDSRDREHEHRRHADSIGGDVEGQKGGGKPFDANEYDQVGNDRWGEPVNAEDDNFVGNGADFDRYEPNHDYDAKGFDGNDTSGSHGSPAPSRSLEKRENSGDVQLKHLDNLRQQPVCYNCGLLGHIMRNCPRGGSTRVDKPNKFHDRRFRDKNLGGRDEEPSRKTHEDRATGGGSLRYGQHFGTTSKFHHKGGERLMKGRHKLPDAEVMFRKKETGPPRKRSGKVDSRSPKKHVKKRKKHASALIDSDSNGTGSPTHSASSGSQFKATSRSYSRFSSSRPNSHPHSSGSRSASVSSYSRLKHRRLRSRLRSDSSSRSGSRPRSRSAMSIPESLSISLDGKCGSSEQKVNAGKSNAPSINRQQRDASITKSGNPEAGIQNPGQELALDAEIVETSVKSGNAFCEKYQGVGMQHRILSENNVAPSVKGDQVASLEKFSGAEDIDGSSKPKMDSGVPDMPNSIGLSTQEMFTLLGQYGMEAPDSFRDGSTVQQLFGAVRFWPWELIYYRRLKKGSISTENYARRVQQNKEFGIVDKYVRSSSGWVVCTENEP